MKNIDINSKTKLPESFKTFLWSYNFSDIDIEKHKKTIIINILNYGDLDAWRFLVKTYGEKQLKSAIESIPLSEFRKQAATLAVLLLGVKFKYVSRINTRKSKKNI